VDILKRDLLPLPWGSPYNAEHFLCRDVIRNVRFDPTLPPQNLLPYTFDEFIVTPPSSAVFTAYMSPNLNEHISVAL
jgi:hypothetical protein